jgi:hypothetical protein
MTLQTPLEDPVIELTESPLTEHVAQVVAGIGAIGHATRLLELAGHTATIVANRITVNHEVEARLTSTNGTFWWDVYAIDGKPPMFVVGAQVGPQNWLGAVE